MSVWSGEERSGFLAFLMDMGEALIGCGAEIGRVEDTLTRLASAYGASEIDVFAIPSLLGVSLGFPGETLLTGNRRIRSTGSTDFGRLEALNTLSREACAERLPLETLRARLDGIKARQKPRAAVLLGSVIAAGSFAVFFGGTLWDALAAAAFALLICALQRRLGETALNQVGFNLIASLLVGLGVGVLTLLLPALHMHYILMGDIMLLIPGLAMTNAVRNMLVGDTISGVVRLAECLIWAGALAGGFMLALLILNLLR